jgi:hypothetical protein
MKNAPVTAGAKDELNKAMREFASKDFDAYPDFPGIDNMSDEWIAGAGKARTKLAKLLDTKKFKDHGFPDMGVVRHAITEPDLLRTPTAAGGYNVSRVTGEAISNPSLPHPTRRRAGGT